MVLVGKILLALAMALLAWHLLSALTNWSAAKTPPGKPPGTKNPPDLLATDLELCPVCGSYIEKTGVINCQRPDCPRRQSS